MNGSLQLTRLECNDSAYPGKFLDLKMLLLLYGYERTEKE
jgi:hypothetical protein